MAEQLQNVKLYLAQYEITTFMNAAALNMMAEAPECTTFGDTAKRHIGGLLDSKVELNGYWQAEAVTGNPDKYLFDRMALANVPLSLCPTTGADLEPVYFYQPVFVEYSQSGKVGDVLAIKVHAEGSGKLIKGTIMFPKSTKIASGNGTVKQLGAVTLAQRVYAALHVFAESGTGGPTLDVKIQSHDDNAFGAGLVDQITFAQATGLTSEFKSTAGPITDTWWRVNYTITGTTPSFTFGVMVGIL